MWIVTRRLSITRRGIGNENGDCEENNMDQVIFTLDPAYIGSGYLEIDTG